MAWFERLTEKCPSLSGDTVALEVAAAVSVAGLLLAAFAPVILAVVGTAVVMTALCADAGAG